MTDNGLYVSYALLTEKRTLGAVCFGLLWVFRFFHPIFYLSLFLQKDPVLNFSRWIGDTIPDGVLIVRVRDTIDRFSLPFKFWQYRLPAECPVENLDVSQSQSVLSGLALKQNQEYLNYVLISCHNVLPEDFVNEGKRYHRGAHYCRVSPLDRFFKPKLMGFFAVHYYAYQNQTP